MDPAARLRSAAFRQTQAVIAARQTTSARRLVAPGPTDAELQALLELAAAAPDHGQRTPWRVCTVPPERRDRLGQALADALQDRDAQATPEQWRAARDKARNAPLLLVAVACLGPREPDTPAAERLVSLGAAIQNLLLGAQALGYGTGLTSGRAMTSARLHRLLDLDATDQPVCCINIGTFGQARPSTRVRPAVPSFTRTP